MPDALRLVLHGRPATKKNRADHTIRTNPKTGRRFVVPIPNPEYRAWEKAVAAQVGQQLRPRPRLDLPCRIDAVFYEHPMQRGDLGGYFDALCDALQHAAVVTNDRRFRRSGWLDIQRDRECPRVEVTITPLEA